MANKLKYGITGTGKNNTISKNTDMVGYSISKGIVIEEVFQETTGETQYIVLVSCQGVEVPIYCTRMSRFGGAHNYEEYNPVGYNDPADQGVGKGYGNRPGDVVIVGHLDGDFGNGVILGGKQHPSREEDLEPNKKSAYVCRINGIEKRITEEGALTYTFNGVGTDHETLQLPVGVGPVIEARGNPLTAGANFGFTDAGDWQVADGKDGGQSSIIIKKSTTPTDGDITITSGTTTIKIAGNTADQQVTVETKGDISLTATKSLSIDSLECSIKAKNGITIESTKGLVLKSSGSELLDLLVQLIDAIGGLTVSSPVGPCSPIQGAPTWPAQVKVIQEKLKLMMG